MLQIILDIILFAAGMGLLVIGGDMMVKNASKLGRAFGVSPMLIGLTIVSLGTSMPEFLVCLLAAIRESSDIATGNIVGSNIANIGLILGLTAVIRPIISSYELLKVEVPIMIAMSVVLYLLSFNLQLGRTEGLLIFLFLPAFIIYTYLTTSSTFEIDEEGNEIITPGRIKLKYVLLVFIGLGGLLLGADLVVNKSVELARTLGVSELIIGVTAVAIGTSLPELTASLIAVYKKEHELVVGNIIGSNIFNIGILGLVSVIQPVNINEDLLKLEYPVLLILSIILLPVMRTGAVISRNEGFLLLLIYLTFIIFLL